MKIALAGLGGAAVQAHLPAIARLSSRGKATFVGAADPDERRRIEVGRTLPRVPLFESAEEMLAEVSSEVLVIAADPSAHADLVELGLRSGVQVVCEKPLVVTRGQYDRVASAHVRRPLHAIVPVHQYRYSPAWVAISRCARIAARLRFPFSLAVDVERPGVDALAVSPWRNDPHLSGGMLADHGVHYLALAWTVEEQLDLLAGLRIWSEGEERSGASCRLRGGVLTIQVKTGAPARQTRIAFDAGRLGIAWCNESLKVRFGNRTILNRRVEALADRAHVNSLYNRFYDDLARNIGRPAWRAHRTAEALVVSRVLVELLERAPAG